MKKYASILLTASLIMAAPVSGHAQTTQRLAATKANDYALVYSLPTTRLTVTLEAEITVKKPGEFYKYAKKYLDIDNPIRATQRHSNRQQSPNRASPIQTSAMPCSSNQAPTRS